MPIPSRLLPLTGNDRRVISSYAPMATKQVRALPVLSGGRLVIHPKGGQLSAVRPTQFGENQREGLLEGRSPGRHHFVRII